MTVNVLVPFEEEVEVEVVGMAMEEAAVVPLLALSFIVMVGVGRFGTVGVVVVISR